MEAPDPEAATTANEFIRRLRALKAWSGGPSLRELERRTGLPRSTLAEALNLRRDRLPPLDRVISIVAACGVSAAEAARWKGAWQRIHLERSLLADSSVGSSPTGPAPAGFAPVTSAPRTEHAPRPPAGQPVGSATPVVSQAVRPPSPRRVPPPRRARFAGWLGLVVAALLAVTLVADRRPDTPGRVATAFAGRISHVGRVGEHIGAPAIGPGFDLQLLRPVARGDALIVSALLTGADAEPVSVTDTAGNAYQSVWDMVGVDRNRFMIFVAVNAEPLSLLSRIRVRWRVAGAYHLAVEEFHGIGTASARVGEVSSGDRHRLHFFSGPPPLCVEGDLLFEAVDGRSGPAPELASGWQSLAVLGGLSGPRVTTAYRLVGRADSCDSTITSTSQWEAVVVRFR